MNYKKQLFFNYRKQCKIAYDAQLNPYTLKLDGQVTINFVWTKDTKYTYECMVIVYHNKPLVQRISSSHLFTDEALYRLVREAEKYALSES